MKTPAIIASLTVAGSIAFAAGHQSGGKQSPPMPSGAQVHSMQEEMPQARRAQTATGCLEGADSIWFTTVHPLPMDCGFPMLGGVADVNGDGTTEYLNVRSVYDPEGPDQPDRCLMSVSDISISQGNLTVTYSCVATSAAALEHVRSAYPQAACSHIAIEGLRDMDADGDLDLIGRGDVFNSPCDPSLPFGSTYFWIENTGLPRNNHVSADLNGDGKVDGADLGMLLVAWGPNS